MLRNPYDRKNAYAGLRAVKAKQFQVTTGSNRPKLAASGLIEQDIVVTMLNQKWAGDISYAKVVEGEMISRGDAGIIFKCCRGFVGESTNDAATCLRCLDNGIVRHHFFQGCEHSLFATPSIVQSDISD